MRTASLGGREPWRRKRRTLAVGRGIHVDAEGGQRFPDHLSKRVLLLVPVVLGAGPAGDGRRHGRSLVKVGAHRYRWGKGNRRRHVRPSAEQLRSSTKRVSFLKDPLGARSGPDDPGFREFSGIDDSGSRDFPGFDHPSVHRGDQGSFGTGTVAPFLRNYSRLGRNRDWGPGAVEAGRRRRRHCLRRLGNRLDQGLRGSRGIGFRAGRVMRLLRDPSRLCRGFVHDRFRPLETCGERQLFRLLKEEDRSGDHHRDRRGRRQAGGKPPGPVSGTDPGPKAPGTRRFAQTGELVGREGGARFLLQLELDQLGGGTQRFHLPPERRRPLQQAFHRLDVFRVGEFAQGICHQPGILGRVLEI